MSNNERATEPEGRKHSCCAGLAYFNKKMQDKGQVPFCLGIRQVKSGDMHADDSQQLSPEAQAYHFTCIGYSSHPYRKGDGSREDKLPYCEGVELVSFEEVTTTTTTEVLGQPAGASSRMGDREGAGSLGQGLPGGEGSNGAQAVGAAPSISGRQEGGRSPNGAVPGDASQDAPPTTFSGRFMAKAHHNLGMMKAALVGADAMQLPSMETVGQVKDKLWLAGTRNAGLVTAAAGRVPQVLSEVCGSVWSYGVTVSKRVAEDKGDRKGER